MAAPGDVSCGAARLGLRSGEDPGFAGFTCVLDGINDGDPCSGSHSDAGPHARSRDHRRPDTTRVAGTERRRGREQSPDAHVDGQAYPLAHPTEWRAVLDQRIVRRTQFLDVVWTGSQLPLDIIALVSIKTPSWRLSNPRRSG